MSDTDHITQETGDEMETEERREASEVNFEGTMQLEEAVSYFEALIGGLKNGKIHLKQGEDEITLVPPPFLGLEVRAIRKKNKEKITFELQWRERDESGLTISS